MIKLLKSRSEHRNSHYQRNISKRINEKQTYIKLTFPFKIDLGSTISLTRLQLCSKRNSLHKSQAKPVESCNSQNNSPSIPIFDVWSRAIVSQPTANSGSMRVVGYEITLNARCVELTSKPLVLFQSRFITPSIN